MERDVTPPPSRRDDLLDCERRRTAGLAPGAFPILTRGHGLWDSGTRFRAGTGACVRRRDPGCRILLSLAFAPSGRARAAGQDAAPAGQPRPSPETPAPDPSAPPRRSPGPAPATPEPPPPRGARLPRPGSPRPRRARCDLGSRVILLPVPGHLVRHPRAHRSRGHRRREGELGPGRFQLLRLRPGPQGRHLPTSS